MTTVLQSLPQWELASRGGGLVARDSHCSKAAFIAPAAMVRSGAEIFGKARIEGASEIGTHARLSGKAIVRASKVLDYSEVADNAQVINKSVLMKDSNSFDCPFVCDEAVVDGSHLHGQVRVCENAKLKNVTVDGNALFRGNCQVEDCEIGGGITVHEGQWTRSPRIWRTGLFHNIVECVSNDDPMLCKILTGCKCATVDQWVKNGRRYGAAVGMNDEQMITFAEIIIYNFVPEEFQSEAFSRW